MFLSSCQRRTLVSNVPAQISSRYRSSWRFTADDVFVLKKDTCWKVGNTFLELPLLYLPSHENMRGWLLAVPTHASYELRHVLTVCGASKSIVQ